MKTYRTNLRLPNVDVVKFLTNEGYYGFDEKKHNNAGFLEPTHLLNCKDPNGRFIKNAKREAENILNSRLEKLLGLGDDT